MFLLELLKTILLGIVEGITEWLPISSTGHLILLNNFIKLDVSEEFWDMFEVVIQLGAILAVVLLFWKRLCPFGKNKPEKKKRRIWNLWFKIIVGVLPSAIIGFLLDDWFNAHFYNYVSACHVLSLPYNNISVGHSNLTRFPCDRINHDIHSGSYAVTRLCCLFCFSRC